MRKRTKIIAATAGVTTALALAVGSGYSLWSDSSNVSNGKIRTGNLDINYTNTDSFDVTENRPDNVDGNGHSIDLMNWKAVPGDTVVIENNFDIALEGDNALAVVDASAIKTALPTDENAKYVESTVTLVGADGAELKPDASGRYLFQPGRTGSAGATPGATVVPNALGGSAEVKVRTTVKFSSETPQRVLAQADLATIGSGEVTLKQVTN